MNEIITFASDELAPDRGVVFENQGIPAGNVVPGHIQALCTKAIGLLSQAAAPMGILSEIPKADFGVVYDGEGRNEGATPVGDIYRRAENLALFAVTVGEQVSAEIAKRFASNEFALGAMLDSAASAAADRMAELAGRHFLGALSREGRATPATTVLNYSPGYCGWDITGQRKLFEFLHPEVIGISLNDSFLMRPLKSVSGVLVAGSKEIHDFSNSYPGCSRCETHSCRARIPARLAD